MYVSIFMIFLNLFVFYILKKKKKYNNDYDKEKNKYNAIKIKKISRIVNIGYITIDSLYYIIILLSIGLSSINNLLLNIIFFIISIMIYLFVEFTTKINRTKLKLIDRKLLDKKEYMYIITFYILFFIEKTAINYSNNINLNTYDFINTFNMILYSISVLLIITLLIFIISYIKNNSKYFTFSNVEENYLEDIKFYKKIEIKRIFNHVIYITAYIVFFYINIPYIFIFYILASLLLIYFAYNKVKKIRNESSRVYRSITIAKTKPGITYAFQFTKDVLSLKKLIIFIILLISSIPLYYGLGESIFAFVALSIYLILLYTIIEDKVYLIRYLASLNDRFINKKEYSILEIKKIDYIETINIFDIKFYRLIIIDTIVYESNIILYDPELEIDNIDIRINKSDILDYITIENVLYEE